MNDGAGRCETLHNIIALLCPPQGSQVPHAERFIGTDTTSSQRTVSNDQTKRSETEHRDDAVDDLDWTDDEAPLLSTFPKRMCHHPRTSSLTPRLRGTKAPPADDRKRIREKMVIIELDVEIEGKVLRSHMVQERLENNHKLSKEAPPDGGFGRWNIFWSYPPRIVTGEALPTSL